MDGPLLDTKLHLPHLRRSVERPRLDAVLGRASEAALTVVSAPAGFGKTTLLAQWLAGPAGDRSAAWLALDPRDNDPAVFWTYLVASLRTAAPEVGAGALALLRTPAPPIDAVLTSLLNDLAALPGELVLVLDDYHVVDAEEVHAGVLFLLEHLPARVHLVLATRADPSLPLARFRGRGELVEIRAADLRFTPDEAADYLNGAMGLTLTAGDVAALESRTEGWIAALQLAALSMQGRDDVAGFLAGFAGDDRHIIDYLAEEVLGRQPAEVRRYLLQTSVLQRLSGPLCDAVTGRTGGKARLAGLERANLFVVPLDDRRTWYRYHHLFADVLQAHLHDEAPDEVAGLHRRASVWFAEHGEPAEAIRHAFAAGDLDRAADLIELAMPAASRGRQEATMRQWFEALPAELVRVRPVLGNGYAGVLLLRGEDDGVEALLHDAEARLGSPAREPRIVADEDGFRRLPGAIAVHRAGLCLMRGDLDGTLSHAGRAVELVGDDVLARGSAAAILGLVHWARGDLGSAYRRYAEGMASLAEAGYLPDVVGGAIALADIRIAQGRLRDAMALYDEGLRRATEGPAPLRGAADMHVGISGLLHERHDLDGARRHLAAAVELGDHAGMPQNPYRSRVAAARLREAEGDLGGALELLDEAERVYAGDFFPEVRPIPARRARIWIAQGRLGPARDWALRQGLSADDELEYRREFEHLTLARLLVARRLAERDHGAGDAAVALLERLLGAAEEGERSGSVLEIRTLQALPHQARGDVPAALGAVRAALVLAEPEGNVRVFVEAGRSMTALLRTLAREADAPAHVHRVLTASAPEPVVAQGPVDALSERERAVLRLLATDLSGPEIARELVVSLHTVRTHTQHIYTKLA